MASGYPLKLFKADAYYLKKLFGSWDKSWKLLLPGAAACRRLSRPVHVHVLAAASVGQC